jgi:hypothetical protein
MAIGTDNRRSGEPSARRRGFPSAFAHIACVGGSALPLAVAIVLASRLGDLILDPIRRSPVEWSAAVLATAYAFVHLITNRGRERAAGALVRADSLAAWALTVGLAWLVALECLALLAAWVPHYLTWPWFRDLDAFASIAQAWDSGVLPYRDIEAYNFPGQIYILWMLGKIFGWGHTALFYAFDVAFLLGLGVALVAWSSRRLEGALPGLVAYLAFLGFYLNLDYAQVAQRDWHATALVVFAILTLESWPGRTGRLASALCAACAFAFRPHVVLFLPALLSAVDENARKKAESASRPVRALTEWSIAFATGIVVAFVPLLAAGVLTDLVHGLRVALYGGPYSHNSLRDAYHALLGELQIGWIPILVGVPPACWVFGPPSMRPLARTWSLAVLGVLAYKPLHPVQHFYLLRPIELVASVVVALAAAWIIGLKFLPRPLVLLAVFLMVCEAMPRVPRYCDARESVQALTPLIRGEEPPRPPPGCRTWFPLTDPEFRPYRWDDYRAILSYLRANTRPETSVANVLRRFPFPPINGPAGRHSPFLVESGICWMWMIDQDRDEYFARCLEQASDAVVVWCPDEPEIEPRMELENVTLAIRRYYRFEVRYGRIEVWRRTVGRPIDP